LIFAGPGIAAGRRDDGGVGLIDVVATVLAQLGVPASERPASDGIDLSERLRPGAETTPRERRRILFAESAVAIWNEATEHVTTGRTWWRVCINGPRFTLCEIPGKKPGVYTLYDHLDDPTLSRDVGAAHPEAVAELLEDWKHWPPESARERVAWTGEYKLVERPRLDGGYDVALYRLPDESEDVGDRFPEVRDHLRRALEQWAADLPEPGERAADPELEASLRTLGYLP